MTNLTQNEEEKNLCKGTTIALVDIMHLALCLVHTIIYFVHP